MDGVSFENNVDQFYKKIESSTSEPSGIYETQNSTLFGMTCDGMDIITKNISTPVEMKVSDWLCISGMGAYTYGCRSNFNGMKSTEKIIKWNAKLNEEYAEEA
jgi:diaminopimelate decarboxylase